jgi:hypothetical protein
VEELLMPQQQMNDENMIEPESLIFNPAALSDEFSSDGTSSANLIFTNTPRNDAPNDFTSRFI